MRSTQAAFRWIISILRKYKIPFQISGGLAARIYGSKRKLADIDIDIPEESFNEILPVIKRYIIFGPIRYKDRNWNLPLITLRYKGQEIDLGGFRKAKIFDKNKKRWVSYGMNPSQAVMKKAYGIGVPTVTKSDLVKYKSKLRRRVDLVDLEQLAERDIK